MSFEKCIYSDDPLLNMVEEPPFAWAPGTREIIDEWRVIITRFLEHQGSAVACYKMKHLGKPNPRAHGAALLELANESVVVFENDTVRLA